MTLYAFDDIDDAIAATRAFLWPVDLRRWAKLALVVFFVGGVGGFNPFSFTSGPPTGGGPGTAPGPPGAPGSLPSIGGPELLAIAAVLALVLVVGLLFLLVGSVMEFVFLDSLRRETVSIRRYWGEHLGLGLRLFGFRVGLGLLSLLVVGGLLLVAFFPLLSGDGGFSVALFLLVLPVFLALAVVGGLIQGFTTVFVAPVMLIEGRGLLSAWRRFWPTVRGQWKQYLAYAVMGFVLQLAAGLVVSIAVVVLAIVVAVPFVLVGLLVVGLAGVGLSGTPTVIGVVVIGLLVALYVLLMIVAVTFVSVPVQVFLRYYALLVLGDTNAAFDLVPERRSAIRDAGDAG